MNGSAWSLTHRQLVSAVIALVLPDGRDGPKPFSELGYELAALELPMVDARSRPYQLDLHLANGSLNLSLLVECKTWAEVIGADQVEKYMATTGAQVIQQSGLNSSDPRSHRADVAFVVLPGVEAVLSRLVAGCPSRLAAGRGMIRVIHSGVEIAHDELSDEALGRSLAAGWAVDVEALPLERLPFESGLPRWELANVLLQTIFSFFVRGRREFGVDDLCAESNGLWAYLGPQHGFIRERVRGEVRTLRRTALAGWISTVAASSGREERWRFARKSTTNSRVVSSFASRHQRYVSILREEERDPRKDDFVEIAPEQMTLPLLVDEPRPL